MMRDIYQNLGGGSYLWILDECLKE